MIQKLLSYFFVFSRQPVLRVVHICTTSTSGLEKTQPKYTLCKLNFCTTPKYIFQPIDDVSLCRMKLALQQSRQSSSILYLGGVQSSIGNSRVMNLTSSCHTSNLALYLWRVVSPLGSKRLKRIRSKHGYISAKERELLESSRYGIIYALPAFFFSNFSLLILYAKLK